jgi:hypothetical protein
MSNTKSAPKVRVRTGLKSAGPILQHGLRVRTNVKAGPGVVLQHGVRVRTDAKAKAAPVPATKPKTGLRVRTDLKSAGPVLQHGVRIRQASR